MFIVEKQYPDDRITFEKFEFIINCFENLDYAYCESDCEMAYIYETRDSISMTCIFRYKASGPRRINGPTYIINESLKDGEAMW